MSPHAILLALVLVGAVAIAVGFFVGGFSCGYGQGRGRALQEISPNRLRSQGDAVCLWPDGTWCYYEDLAEYAWVSDDYEVIPVDDSRWDALVNLEAM